MIPVAMGRSTTVRVRGFMFLDSCFQTIHVSRQIEKTFVLWGKIPVDGEMENMKLYHPACPSSCLPLALGAACQK
jgi:hypothetical protein